MLTDLTLRDWVLLVAALIAAGTAMGGMIIAWVRWQLIGTFADKSSISGLSDRLERVEAQVAAGPSHTDMRALSDRVAAVERQVDVVGAEVRGVRDGVARIEHGLNMITNHLLRAERGA